MLSSRAAEMREIKNKFGVIKLAPLTQEKVEWET